MKTKFASLIIVPLALALSGCGDTWGERAVTGGGIGAGAGLAVGAIAGWPLLAPALAGAAGGARLGAGGTHKKEQLAQQKTQLAVEDAEDLLERFAVRKLARTVVDHVAAGARHLGDGKQGLLGGVAEDREDRHARPEVDGIVAPFARGDAQAVEVEKPGQFPPIE